MKSLADFFSSIRRQKSAEAQTAEQLYQKLVVAVADGEVPTIDETMPILSDAARTPEDLERDVTRLLNRREWRAMLDQEPDLRKKAEKLAKAIQDERDRFLEFRKQHEQKLFDLGKQDETIRSQLSACADARAKLMSTAPRELDDQIVQNAREEIAPIQERLQRLENDLYQLTSFAMANVEKDSDDYRRLKAQADKLRSEKTELNSKLELLHQRTGEIQQLQLQP